MNKLALAAAVATAAAISAGAHAARPINATFTNGGLEMFIGNTPVVINCLADSKTFSIDGANASTVQMQGSLCLDPNLTGDAFVRLTFNAVTGAYTNVAPTGVTFTSGVIAIDVQTTGGYVPYGSVDVAANNINCLDAQTGHLGGAQTTAGLQIPAGVTALPGIWDGVNGSTHYDDAICVVTNLFGQNAGLFAAGKVVR